MNTYHVSNTPAKLEVMLDRNPQYYNCSGGIFKKLYNILI